MNKNNILIFAITAFMLCISLIMIASSSSFVFAKKVIDGDTIVLASGEKIRLIGVDTPELHHPSKPVQYFAMEAATFTKNLIEGKEVRLEYDIERTDKYGRTLAYVYLKNGNLVNAEIIKQGYGFAYTKFPFKYLDSFREFEKQARENKLGLWADSGKKEYKWLLSKKVIPIIIYPMSGNFWIVKYKNWILSRVHGNSLQETVEWVKYKANELIDNDLGKELIQKGWIKDE